MTSPVVGLQRAAGQFTAGTIKALTSEKAFNAGYFYLCLSNEEHHSSHLSMTHAIQHNLLMSGTSCSERMQICKDD